MAEVQYAIRRQQDQVPQLVAVKRILGQYVEDQNFRRFFAAEAELTRALKHPNVVDAFDAGSVEDQPYIAMEYIHGRALNRVLYLINIQGKRLPIPYAVFIAMQAAEALDYVHRAVDDRGRPLNAILCDISPSNVMLAYDGRVKLIDFGIATSQVKFFEQIGMLKGKKNYMAPEQLRGLPLDHRADIFSLGLCLIELLTGEALFVGKSEFEVEESVRSGRLPTYKERVPNLSPDLNAVIERSLAMDPEQRFATAGEFAQALRPFAKLSKGPVQGADLAKVLALYLTQQLAKDNERLAAIEESLARAVPNAVKGDPDQLLGPQDVTPTLALEEVVEVKGR